MSSQNLRVTSLNSYFSYFMDFIAPFIEHFGSVLPYALGYIAILWISVVFWVAKDISNRSLNAIFQIFCILITIILPLLGLFIYLLIRPEKTLLEKDFEELFYVLREKGIM